MQLFHKTKRVFDGLQVCCLCLLVLCPGVDNAISCANFLTRRRGPLDAGWPWCITLHAQSIAAPLPPPPHLHLTTSKVMVIVWRLRGNIIRTVLYIGNVLPLQWAQLTKTVHTARLDLEFDFLCFFRLHDLSLCSCMFCFTLVS